LQPPRIILTKVLALPTIGEGGIFVACENMTGEFFTARNCSVVTLSQLVLTDYLDRSPSDTCSIKLIRRHFVPPPSLWVGKAKFRSKL
jgi:hypothetical protein